MPSRRFVKTSHAKADPHAWVKARLDSWGKWIELSERRGYLPSSLTIDPHTARHALPRFVPVSEMECSETDTAVGKQPQQLRALAVAEYVYDMAVIDAARQLGVSDRQYRRLREMLHNGVAYCLKNSTVPVPPPQVLLKPSLS